MAENIVTQKVGPLPLVVWVAGGAGVIGLFILMSHKGNNGASGNQTNQVQSLAPTEAEAFGTIEQQQQDVTNALTTLGQNQSALGGSLSTLTGIVTQQGSDNAAAFQNLVNGQNSILQGQTSASDQATNYYNSLFSQMGNLSTQATSNFNQLALIQTDPWVKAFYQSALLRNLSPQTQQYFWDATRAQAQGLAIFTPEQVAATQAQTTWPYNTPGGAGTL